MKKSNIRVLTINPGSTSTKIGVFDNDKCVLKTTIEHTKEELSKFPDIPSQKEYRYNLIIKTLEKNKIAMESFDAFSGRGGGLECCPGGTYLINKKLYDHARTCHTIKHPATLGATLSYEFGKKYHKPAFCVNPPDVDEFIVEARITGIPGIYRESRIHALNQKETAIRYAKSIGKKYTNLNLIVCHLGGGVSIAAHQKGKMIDCNDIVNGDGPMAPTRSGFIPAKPLIDLCFSGKYTQKELSSFMTKTGGLIAHLGTNDLREVRKMVNKGNKKATIIYNALVYQIAKQIGAMYASLKCNCSAIIFTGGMSNDKQFIMDIKQYVKKMAKVVIMPGELELEGLAAGAIRVMTGEEESQTYTGVTVFKGI